jgi:hypothetical protein
MKSSVTNVTFCIVIFFLVTIPNIFISQGNPMPIDRGSGTTPIPLENTSGIYLKEEEIIVMFDEEKAYVEAKYIFKNNNSKITDIKILLPFRSMPTNITVLIEGAKENYEWATDFGIDDLDNEIQYGIICELHFDMTREIELILTYSRGYLKDPYSDDETFFSFTYIIWTTKYWNHSIEFAHFEFWIPEDLLDRGPHSGNIKYNITTKEGFIIATKEFTNMTHELGVIDIDWYKEPEPPVIDIIEDSTSFPTVTVMIISMVVTLLVISIIVILLKKKKKRDTLPKFIRL